MARLYQTAKIESKLVTFLMPAKYTQKERYDERK